MGREGRGSRATLLASSVRYHIMLDASYLILCVILNIRLARRNTRSTSETFVARRPNARPSKFVCPTPVRETHTPVTACRCRCEHASRFRNCRLRELSITSAIRARTSPAPLEPSLHTESRYINHPVRRVSTEIPIAIPMRDGHGDGRGRGASPSGLALAYIYRRPAP